MQEDSDYLQTLKVIQSREEREKLKEKTNDVNHCHISGNKLSTPLGVNPQGTIIPEEI